jgi:hypothetical protein
VYQKEKSTKLTIFKNIHIVHNKDILGITNHQFQDLLPQGEMQHKELQGDIESKNIGINQKGGGGKGN